MSILFYGLFEKWGVLASCGCNICKLPFSVHTGDSIGIGWLCPYLLLFYLCWCLGSYYLCVLSGPENSWSSQYRDINLISITYIRLRQKLFVVVCSVLLRLILCMSYTVGVPCHPCHPSTEKHIQLHLLHMTSQFYSFVMYCINDYILLTNVRHV
jgi:hypothetical protein